MERGIHLFSSAFSQSQPSDAKVNPDFEVESAYLYHVELTFHTSTVFGHVPGFNANLSNLSREAAQTQWCA